MAKAPVTSLTQLVSAYLDDLRARNYKPKTITGYAKNLKTFMNWAETQQATLLTDFDAELVRSYIRYLQHKIKWAEREYAVKTQELVSASAIRNYVRDLKAFAAWLAEEHYTSGHVLLGVRTPKADETPIRATFREVEQVRGIPHGHTKQQHLRG